MACSTGPLDPAGPCPAHSDVFGPFRLRVHHIDKAYKRTDGIVSNKYRKAYGKAAKLIAACGEALKAVNQAKEASHLVTKIRQNYPRHRAFQEELDKNIEG